MLLCRSTQATPLSKRIQPSLFELLTGMAIAQPGCYQYWQSVLLWWQLAEKLLPSNEPGSVRALHDCHNEGYIQSLPESITQPSCKIPAYTAPWQTSSGVLLHHWSKMSSAPHSHRTFIQCLADSNHGPVQMQLRSTKGACPAGCPPC